MCLVCTCLVCLSICLSASLPVTRVYCDLKRLCDSCGTTAPSQPGDVQAHAGLRPEGPAVRHQRLPGRRREAHHEQAQRHREGRAARRRAGRGRNSHVGEHDHIESPSSLRLVTRCTVVAVNHRTRRRCKRFDIWNRQSQGRSQGLEIMQLQLWGVQV